MPLEELKLRPTQSRYAYRNQRDAISVELDGGFSRTRRDVDGAAGIVNCEWIVSQAHYQYLRAFYDFKTQRGASPFLIQLLIEQPYLETYEAKFVANTFEMSEPLGLSFSVSAQLEVIPVNDDEFSELVILLFDEKDAQPTFTNIFEQLVNYDLEVYYG